MQILLTSWCFLLLSALINLQELQFLRFSDLIVQLQMSTTFFPEHNDFQLH
jgi:hypothetical protein